MTLLAKQEQEACSHHHRTNTLELKFVDAVELIAGKKDVNCGFGGAFHDGAANNSPPFLGLGLVRGFPLIRTWFVVFVVALGTVGFQLLG